MVKNESRIIRRMINSTMSIIDAICVLDTGSTDNTVEISRQIIAELGIPGKVYEDKFVDFGYSRSKSFECARNFLSELGWDADTTYGLLLDADMKLVVKDPFKKTMLGEFDSYKIKQIQNSTYFNTRFIRMNLEWKCIGKTHEFWCTVGVHKEAAIEDEDLIWIDDVSDGGCKKDKFERDERLLLKGIEEEPMLRSRYYFYLGQTYLCLKNYEKSMEYYKKRIEEGGWYEEVWFSYFAICQIYIELDNKEFTLKYEKEIEDYAIKAFEFNSKRSDSLFFAGQYFLVRNKLDKVQEYIDKGKDVPFPSKELIFVEPFVYEKGFDILQFELYAKNRDKRVVKSGIALMNKCPDKKNIILEIILKYTDTAERKSEKLLEVPENTHSLSLASNEDGFLYLISDSLCQLNDEFEIISEKKTQINCKGVCLIDDQKFISLAENTIGKLDGEFSTYTDPIYINDTCSLKNIEFEPCRVFLSYFDTHLPASKHEDMYYLLTRCRILNFSTVYFVIVLDSEGKLLKTSLPFFINDQTVPSGVCSFSMKDDRTAAIIYNQEEKFHITKITIPF